MAFCPKRILLASDFKEAARAAEADAVLLARAFDAEVIVVHVQPFSWQNSPDLAASGTAGLRRCTERLRESGVRTRHPELLHGSAAEAFLQAAEASPVDLIVIGAAARGSVVGATAETVARFAQKPVWMSRPRPRARIERILCGVDGSLASEHAACDAVLLARTLSASLVFAHVADASETEAIPPTEGEQRRALVATQRTTIERIDRFLDGLGTLGMTADRRHVTGRPAEVLRRMVHEESYDLLVMGRVGAGGLRRVLLGSTAESLLRKLPCALLLTSPEPSSGPRH